MTLANKTHSRRNERRTHRRRLRTIVGNFGVGKSDTVTARLSASCTSVGDQTGVRLSISVCHVSSGMVKTCSVSGIGGKWTTRPCMRLIKLGLSRMISGHASYHSRTIHRKGIVEIRPGVTPSVCLSDVPVISLHCVRI